MEAVKQVSFRFISSAMSHITPPSIEYSVFIYASTISRPKRPPRKQSLEAKPLPLQQQIQIPQPTRNHARKLAPPGTIRLRETQSSHIRLEVERRGAVVERVVGVACCGAGAVVYQGWDLARKGRSSRVRLSLGVVL
jgi:hypothetical protein